MAKIMQEGLLGYQIADLLNDANARFQFFKGKFEPPAVYSQKKERYAYDWLSKLNDKGWDKAIRYIGDQLLDESRAYFAEDEDHVYPETQVAHLRAKMYPDASKGKRLRTRSEKDGEIPSSAVGRIHGKRLSALLVGITNDAMRECIRSDIRDIESCLAVSAWKPATVMAGSVLEAILSDWLCQQEPTAIDKAYKGLYPKRSSKAVEGYTLEELIDVAENLGVIHGYHASIGDGIRGFRNLIHPNLALRQQIKSTQSLAEIGLKLIFDLLQRRMTIS